MQAPASPQKSVGRKRVPRWKEGVYKAHAENLCHGYQATLLMILNTMKVLFVNDYIGAKGWFFECEHMNRCHKIQYLRIGEADFLHCWVTDSS